MRTPTSTSRRLLGIWALLLILTLGSVVVGAEQGRELATAATVVIVGVALVKVRLIGTHFMELRNAPRLLRLIFDGYVVAVFLVLTVLDMAITS